MKYLLFLFLISCQPIEQTDSTENRTAPQIGDTHWEEADLSDDEKNLARIVCQALQDKVNVMKRDFVGKSITFSVDRRNCGQSMQSANVNATLQVNPVSRDLEYIPRSFALPIRDKVQTDEIGDLAAICPKVLNGTQTNNKVNDNGLDLYFRFFTPTSGNWRVQVQQMPEGTTDVHTLRELTIASTSTANKPLGLVTDRILIQDCGSNNSIYWRQKI